MTFNLSKKTAALVLIALFLASAFSISTTCADASDTFTKTLDPTSGELGDVVHVTLTVSNLVDSAVKVVDTLPPEWNYLPCSFTVNSVPAKPNVVKGVVSYEIAASGNYIIEFDAKVTEACWEDRAVTNTATATWYNVDGSMVNQKTATAGFVIYAFEQLQKTVCEDWPTFHHDVAQNGYTTSKAPDTNDVLWTYATGSSITSSPAVVDGTLYIGVLDGSLIALDANTGSLLWSYAAGGQIRSSPAVAYGKVYFLSTNGILYALDAITGTLVWSAGGLGGPWSWSSPAVHNDRVFIGASNGYVHSLDAATGAIIWSTEIGGSPNSPIAVANGKVYSGTHNFDASAPTLAALDELTGDVIWTYDYDHFHGGVVGMINSNGVSVADGDVDGDLEVYFGVYLWGGGGPTAIALNEEDGSEKWTQNINGMSTSTPAVHDGKVFIGSDDYNVYALDAGTGAVIWSYLTGASVWSAPAVADGKVFVASLDHIFYALNEQTGSLVWSYDTSTSRMEGSPAVACGKVFVGNENGKVYAWGTAYYPLEIKAKTNVQWTLVFKVTNPFSYTMTNAILTDNLGAELEIDLPFPLSITQGTASYSLSGKSNKVHLTWNIGDLLPYQTATLTVLVSTDLNPAGKQEYTKPGVYEMNSGATLKFIDPVQEMQLSSVTAPILVTVLP